MGLPKFRRTTRCAFCDNKANSKEHAWSDWTLGRLEKPDYVIAGAVDGQTHFDPNQKQLRVKCVCIPCNTGWMGKNEEAVLPVAGCLMRDLSMWLDQPQRETLARWAV